MAEFLDILQSCGDQLEITTKNGKAWTTSMSIGRFFRKGHDQVLKDIRRIWMPETFRKMNFHERWKSFKNPCTGRNNYSPYYDCSMKGVMILVLNWQGEFFQRLKIDIVNDYFYKHAEIERLSSLIEGHPYQEVDKWQRKIAEEFFNPTLF